MPTTTASTAQPHSDRPAPGSRAEHIRAKRQADQADRKAKSIALQACLVPFLVVAVVIGAFAVMDRPNILVGLINLAIILYASFCTVRTWINIFQKRHGLWIQVVIATIINGFLLAIVGMMVGRLIRGY